MLQRCDGQKAGIFNYHFMILHHVQEGCHQLLILHRYDFVNVLLYVGENHRTRRFYRRAVRDGIHALQGDHLARLQGLLHAVCSRRLHTDHVDLGI